MFCQRAATFPCPFHSFCIFLFDFRSLTCAQISKVCLSVLRGGAFICELKSGFTIKQCYCLYHQQPHQNTVEPDAFILTLVLFRSPHRPLLQSFYSSRVIVNVRWLCQPGLTPYVSWDGLQPRPWMRISARQWMCNMQLSVVPPGHA